MVVKTVRRFMFFTSFHEAQTSLPPESLYHLLDGRARSSARLAKLPNRARPRAPLATAPPTATPPLGALNRRGDLAQLLGEQLILAIVNRDDDQTGALFGKGLLQRISQFHAVLDPVAMPAEGMG